MGHFGIAPIPEIVHRGEPEKCGKGYIKMGQHKWIEALYNRNEGLFAVRIVFEFEMVD